MLEFQRDEAVRAVILTGAAGNLCSGADIGTMTDEASADARRQHMLSPHSLVTGLLQRPLIAAVPGVAFGVGCELALTADFTLATPCSLPPVVRASRLGTGLRGGPSSLSILTICVTVIGFVLPFALHPLVMPCAPVLLTFFLGRTVGSFDLGA